MRSWQPRRPSAGLKGRVWLASKRRTFELGVHLRWLTPVAACLLLAISAVKQSENTFQSATRARFAPSVIESNQIAYVPESCYRPRENWFPATFEWTNLSGSTSSIGSFLPGKAN